MDNITNAEIRQMCQQFEEATPYPQSVAPAIPQGQQLGTIDKLAQAVIPKLVDKLNIAEWKIKRLMAICESQQEMLHNASDILSGLPQAFSDVYARVAALEQGKKTTKTRKTKESKPAEPSVDITEIADYDPDTDSWGPIEIDGHKLTGALIDVIEHLSGAADSMYSDELIGFIQQLEPQVKAAIAKKFPN